MRKWLKKIFGLSSPTFEGWGELLEAKEARPFWPRIAKSSTWQNDLEPWYRQALLFTLFELAREKDERRIVRLQERALLLNEWLEAPVIAMARENALLTNLAETNRLDIPAMAKKGEQYG